MYVLAVLVAVLAVVVLFAYLQFRWRQRRVIAAASSLPCPPALPLIGNAFFFLGGINKLTKCIIKFTTEFKGLFCIWIGPVPLFVVTDPSDVQIVLNSSNMLEKDDVYKFLQPFLGNGLLTAPVPIWKKYRRLISPVLHPSNVENFIPAFNDVCKELAQDLQDKGGLVDPRDAIFCTAFDAILRTVFKLENVNNNKLKQDIQLLFDSVGKMFISRLFKVWLHLDCVFNLIYRKELKRVAKSFEDCTKVFDEKYEETRRMSAGNHLPCDPKNLIVKTITDLSHSIPDEPDHKWLDDTSTMVVGATDTVVSSFSFLLLTLANHPLIQAKVHAEIKEVLGDSDRDLTLHDLNSLKYTGLCILEGMRLHGAFPVILRKATKDTKLSSKTLPAGARVMVGLLAMGWNEDLFPSPEKFQPERFSPEACAERHNYAFLPFSGGPRNCVGKTYAMLLMKTMLAQVLRRFRVRSNLRLEDVEYELKVVMFSKTPVLLEFQHR